MSDHNIESEENAVQRPLQPIWLIIIKWVLVVINCMWLFADTIAIIMGTSVGKGSSELPNSDSTIRIQASIELFISLIGVIGLIGGQFMLLVVHCFANSVYYITIFFIKQSELFVFAAIWILTTVFYAYQLKFGHYGQVLDPYNT